MVSYLETDLILGLAIAGATLGLVEGIKPGPLLTMVIRETLSGGLRAGLWTAAAPIFTDGPLVIFSLFAAAWIATNPASGNYWVKPQGYGCLLYTSPSPRDVEESRMPSSA